MKKQRIELLCNYSELIIHKLNKSTYLKLKTDGLPDSGSSYGEDFYDKFESSSYYFEISQSNISQFSICLDGKPLHGFNDIVNTCGYEKNPVTVFDHKRFGKYILLCHRNFSGGYCTFITPQKFNLEKISISINPYNAFGVLEDTTLDICYDNMDFEMIEGGGFDSDRYILLCEGEAPFFF